MKTVDTLEEDIREVISKGEIPEEIFDWVGEEVSKSLKRQLSGSRGERKRTLRASNLGTPCDRKLWYHVNWRGETVPLPPSTLNKFIFGDLTEAYLLGLVVAAGHDLSGLQDPMDICGIRGHRDCVIDGMLFDVKSASSRAFEKFKRNGLRSDDPFGYLSQLSSYLFASQHDDLVTNKTHAGFLVMDKQFGHIAVDIYDLSEEVEKKAEEVEFKKRMVKGNIPERPYEPVPEGKSGNTKLPTPCSYCDFKNACWPEARGFIYANGPRWLVDVVKQPNVPEIGGENF